MLGTGPGEGGILQLTRGVLIRAATVTGLPGLPLVQGSRRRLGGDINKNRCRRPLDGRSAFARARENSGDILSVPDPGRLHMGELRDVQRSM